MKLTNKNFAKKFLKLTEEIIEEANYIKVSNPSAKREIERATIKLNAIKQANNIFRSSHQHDVARAKIKGYESSFLEEEE